MFWKRKKRFNSKSWIGKMEKWFLSLAIIGALFIFIIQFVFSPNPILKVNGEISGIDFEKELSVNANINGKELLNGEMAVITFQLMDFTALPKVKILINGEVQGDFTYKYATIQVKNGDIIKIDATFYNQPFKIRLMETSRNVLEPTAAVYELQQEVYEVGRVVIEE